MASSLRILNLILVALAYLGCATYQKKVDEARSLLQSRQSQKAVETLKPLAEKENDDQLVYLFDYATALQDQGDYKQSNSAFLKSDRLSEIVDYHSLTRLTGSLLLNEGMVQYKGDDYEKVMINAMMALNFLMMKDSENALVSARRLNEKLNKYRFEAKRNYEQNPFAFYLSAMIWENDRNYDNAYISYSSAYKVKPDIPYLQEDLIRGAIAAQRPEEVEKWQKQFPDVKIKPEWRRKDYGEIVLIFQQGWGPRKFPHPNFPRVPKLYPTATSTKRARMTVEGVGDETTQTVFSIQDVAIKTLDDQYAPLIATRVAGIAAKAVVADQIRQKNALLGDLAWIGMNIADRADLRQWSTLPETFQVARMWVPAGTYKVSAVGLGWNQQPSGEIMASQDVQVKARQKAFVMWRSYR